MNDRYALEQQYLMPLTTGSGPLGTMHVDLTNLKREKLNLMQDKAVPNNKQLLNKLEIDGIYVDDPEVY